jgi:hypothetical protein
MIDDPLQGLLRQADRAVGLPPALPDGFAARIRDQAARRRHARRITRSSLAAILVLVISAALFTRLIHLGPTPHHNSPITARSDQGEREIAQLRAEIADLRRQADSSTDLIQRLQDGQRTQQSLAALERFQGRPDPIELVDQELDRAAFVTFYQADRMLNELNLPDAAAQSYHQVIDRFGGTKWAALARKRLDQIRNTKGGV